MEDSRYKFRVWLGKRFWFFDIHSGFNAENEDQTCDPEQYTGLKDKNGVEIYEGDEVLLGDNPFKNVVVFRRGGFYAESAAFYSLLAEHNFIEVIGNIYEVTK